LSGGQRDGDGDDEEQEDLEGVGESADAGAARRAPAVHRQRKRAQAVRRERWGRKRQRLQRAVAIWGSHSRTDGAYGKVGDPVSDAALELLCAADRFDAVVAANTLLPTCEAPPLGVDGWPGEIISNWVAACRSSSDLPISEIVAGVCIERPTADVLRAYDAPFPDASYKSGALQITCCIPIAPDMPGVIENKTAWNVVEKFAKPFLTAFSDRDPSTKQWESVFRSRVRGAAGQPKLEIAGAGHFLQEEQGPALAKTLLSLMDRIYR